MAEKVRLFFTEGKTPTFAERAQAAALGITCFRNASRIGAASALEAAVEVAGCVPNQYKTLKGCRIVEAPKNSEKK